MTVLNFSPHRLIALGVAICLVFLFCVSALRQGSAGAPIQSLKDSAQAAAHGLCSSDGPLFSKPSFQDSIFKLYDSIRHPVNADTYTDSFGKVFNVTGNAAWDKSLGSEVLIVDMDTRPANGTNELFNPDTMMNWEKLNAKQDGGMVSAAFMNHFLYSQIHGYDYRFYHAQHMEDHHDTWIKPHVLFELLHSYKFVVFIDADATIQHLELPIEWLFNRWNIGTNTSIAMPIDTRQVLDGDENASCDSKGKVTLNTGVVIAQNLPYTFDMLNAWRTCTDEKRYPGCGTWKGTWSHEQRAFSEYIRYDYDNIVELPCDEAMGYPGLKDKHPHIQSDCTGQFIRHHTIDKDMTKTSVGNAMLQTLTEIMQKTLLQNAQFRVTEGKQTQDFMEKYKDSRE